MSTNEYVPVSWNGEAISNDKLNQMANNTQFLYDRTPRVRYASGNIVRDASIKVLSGKTVYAQNLSNWAVWQPIYFGSFFTAGCHPVVQATVEPGGPAKLYHVTIVSLQGTGVEIDHTGFHAAVWNTDNPQRLDAAGWIHWTATGW